jgi:23S rRNA (adenine2503-C2)-methyltransferase
MSAPRVNLLDLAPADALSALTAWCETEKLPRYRAAQILRHLWVIPATAAEAMTDLPVAVRARMAECFTLPRLTLVSEQASIDGTRKFLFRLADGQEIETVSIPDGDRVTFCVSSQAGCALKCAFCATGAMGFARQLAPHEIAGQVRELALLDPPLHATNVVFMGMGEPMMNWDAVSTALTILNSPEGFGIGARRITVSTVGVLPGIEALAQRPEQFRLAISIHAPSDALRRDLMPINVKYPLADVIQAARAFDRRVTFEYVMLEGVNDAPEHADALAALARECGAFVNLIPLHPGGSLGFTPTSRVDIGTFARRLRGRGVETAVRKSRGIDIAAACGQLRADNLRRGAKRGAEKHGEIEVAG